MAVQSVDKRLAAFIGVVITLVWAASFVSDIAVHGYDPPTSIHALMMIVAGAAFGSSIPRPKLRTPAPDQTHQETDRA